MPQHQQQHHHQISFMYGLPKNIDLRFLIGKELLSISVAPNEVILRFDDYLTINITSECDYQPSVGEILRIENYPASASLICRLLCSTITEVKGDEDGTLSVKFSNGDMLTICDDSKQYESYQIKHGDKLIVV
jgi:hypothetical protein